ncbi:CotY/CotZ family spore coat protein [Thalassobacillus sp. B23F22_16]|uniref:CotY/CotZ family spore coat protein n=1 Tax=Thalassobacillus sp. B23F22_16 TaxID=3459513 RepID=UPI00373F82AD
MSCKCKKDNCVCRKVRKIAEAQDAVENNNCCSSGSCENAIKDLLSPTGNGNGNDTIPFMLLCGCENTFAGLLPYFAWGIYEYQNECSGPIPSPFFRVKKVKDDCCAVLELLYPSLCDASSFPLNLIQYDGWYSTGACVEVDLSCFTGITCFEPTTTTPITNAALAAGLEAVNDMRADSANFMNKKK